MYQVTPPDCTFTVKIHIFDDSTEPYCAWIEGSEYDGIIVQASSIDECMKELGISIKVLDLYRKNTKPVKPTTSPECTYTSNQIII